MFRKRQKPSFSHDFRAAYGKLAQNPTLTEDGTFDFDRASRLLGDYRYPSAESLACEWYEAELRETAGHPGPGDDGACVTRIWLSFQVVDSIPDAAGVIVELAERMYDEGRLAGPYDERADYIESGSTHPLDAYEPGPARLAALVTLANYATRIDHQRKREWRDVAIAAASACPDAAAALAPGARTSLDEIAL